YQTMFPKGKSSVVPSDGQAREKLALYVYEYLLHIGAQKSAQTFLSEIRWEKNITLGDPPGFLHSWWCVFWDLYCAAPERRDSCEHSSEAKAFHDYSAAAAPSPVMGNMPPGEGLPSGPMPPGFFQPFMSPRFGGGPRPPIRMGNQNFGSGMRPPHNSMGPGMPGVFPIGPGSEGPLGAMAGMDPMHMNGGSGDLEGLPKNSPNNMSNLTNNLGPPRDDDAGGYLHSFQNENQYSPSMTMSV
uniref:LisH domain-containing protein n=1 Tax=Electrophorus electricus TaxID=8005 RepID=A0AAY5EBF7_ELEEL